MEEQKHNYIHSHLIRTLLWILGGLILLFLSFQIGVIAGMHRASQRFGGPFGYTGFSSSAMMIGGHGTVGTISSVSLPRFVLATRSNESQGILISSSTVIRDSEGNASSSALSTGEQVVVIGTPDQSGTIDAELVRIMPPPATSTPGYFFIMTSGSRP
ncbi:MAG: hypothetical protein KGJ34_02175 [Patescibacteria group bacterium]|nr:hypothetical protein [Patescibacteria group bacterium]